MEKSMQRDELFTDRVNRLWDYAQKHCKHQTYEDCVRIIAALSPNLETEELK